MIHLPFKEGRSWKRNLNASQLEHQRKVLKYKARLVKQRHV